MAEDAFYSSFIVNSVLNAFSAYSAIMLNIVTIHALRKTSSSSISSTLRTLLLSLAVSDLGVGLLVQPLYIIVLVKLSQQKSTDSLSKFVHDTQFLAATLFSVSSLLSVTALSVDRFLAVHLHLRYQELVTHKRVVAAVISIWLFCAFIAVLTWNLDWEKVIILIVVIWSLSFICSTIIYCKMYVALRRLANEMQSRQVREAQNYEIAVNAVKQRKFAVSAFYVFVVFLFCYLPHTCVFVLRILVPDNTTLQTVDVYALTLVYLNSALNPVVYCWKLRHIRHAIMEILRKLHFWSLLNN